MEGAMLLSNAGGSNTKLKRHWRMDWLGHHGCNLLSGLFRYTWNMLLVCFSIAGLTPLPKAAWTGSSLLQLTVLRQYTIPEGSQSRVREAGTEAEAMEKGALWAPWLWHAHLAVIYHQGLHAEVWQCSQWMSEWYWLISIIIQENALMTCLWTF